MNVEFLPDRHAVIGRSIEFTAATSSDWVGMGRTAAWIKLPEFRIAVDEAKCRGTDFRVKGREIFAAGLLPFIVHVTQRAFPHWLGLG
jgi:hypothetical protein